MRFAVLADTHIGRSIPLMIADYRREAFEKAFSKSVDAIVEARVDYVFICGDLFERRSLRPNMVQFVHNELYRLAKQTEDLHGKSVKILIIRGNHDGRIQSDALDYLKHPLAEYLHVFGDDNIVFRDDGLYVVGLNYYDLIDAAFDKLVRPAFEGAKGLKILMAHGFVSNYNVVPPGDASLSLEQLDSVKPDFVFTGHYHRRCQPKKLPSGGWLVTPGSTEAYDFAEDPGKGFYIIDTDCSKFTWVPIEPIHIMKQVVVDAGDRRMPPKWYEEKALDAATAFVTELRAAGKEGYIRVKIRGGLSEGWPSDISLDRLNEVKTSEPYLLWADVDTLDIDLPPSIAHPQAENTDVIEYFKDFGGFAEVIREMHGKVRDSLEEEASTRTGLLTAMQREQLVSEWVRRFEERSFREKKS
jgi:DNA repair exonuclease SbcCD nuclease subunit